MRRLYAGVLGVLAMSLGVAAMLAPSTTFADVFEPIQLASVTPTEQVNSAEDADISADGRFLVFDGRVAGVQGVWRRDLLTGSIEPVAGEDREAASINAPDARRPSISADGRYVSFTTTAALDPANDTNAAPDVYVRDMTVEAIQPGAFTLVSAADQSSRGLTYDFGGQESFGRGSVASGRSAITADGRHVVFVTTATSNLAEPALTDTPPLQVAVRDLDTERTRLVSTRYDASTGQMTAAPVPTATEGGLAYGAVFHQATETFVPSFPEPFDGASISADGSTVAWMGQSIGEQAGTLASDPANDPYYSEPLWRRIADGPQAPTRRVTGGSDPADPACPSGELQVARPAALTDPCEGPFEPLQEGTLLGIFDLAGVERAPQLSADGDTVAFLSNAREIAAGEQFGLTANLSDDLYVVDMHDGLTRQQALRRLTEIASANGSDVGRVAPIVDFGVSPDGGEVAFSTLRTTFPLGSPAYVTAAAANAGAQELFDVDLANDTLTRVTQGYEGGVSEPAKATVSSPSFSADGNTLAFSSTAYNLVYGDGNGASDAFLVKRKRFVSSIIQQSVSPAPGNPVIAPDWRLSLSARSRRDGSVLLEVAVPGAGSLRATASSALRVRARRARAGRRASAGRGSSTAVVTRQVASAAKAVPAASGGLASLRLLAAVRYRALAARRGGLSSSITVTFTAPGHKALRARITVRFVRRGRSHKARSSQRARAGDGGSR